MVVISGRPRREEPFGEPFARRLVALSAPKSSRYVAELGAPSFDLLPWLLKSPAPASCAPSAPRCYDGA